MVSDWLDLMPATVTYSTPTGRNSEGLPIQGTANSYRARVSREAVRTANRFSGQDEIAAGRVWIAAVLSPTIDDRITLPDGTQPVIVNWNVVSDEVASHHTVIFFGATQATRSA